ncbi:Fatty acyl-CoA reductase 1 [Araneus ventricosus]|uniref:Fatty acyl-CoA reductase n=1 Tax=Araneus ventricosus TaxID=182803 RepID=A0A4Y2H2Y6_ARAVE|nr:Fatty acyl-CoA reductase 1 [Araneus ventricosus]
MFESSPQDNHVPRFANFYDGKSVFVTGASGFIGAVLLETLLRCCPGIKSIYILLRSKKNVQPEARKEQIFNRKLFEKFKEETPEILKKVRVISGDASLPKLGMNEEDIQLLVDEVSVVFHCAADINFIKPLQFVLTNNVLSVSSVIELCRQMRKFEALVYTSTAYSNSNHLNLSIKEEIHRLPIRAEKFLDALKNEDNEMLQELIARCKPDWPNSYTFSKCLAENVIMDTASDLPVAIIRPSVVISTWKHPMPGYVEGNSGLTALSLGVGKGFIKVAYADPHCKVNLVPADIVANSHVLAAWSVGTKRSASPLIVNCTATESLDVKFSEHNESLTELVREFPLPQSFAQPQNLIIVPYKYLYYILAAYYHYLPAIFLDGMLRILGKKPRVYSLYRFLDTVMSSVNFFLFRNFEFERKNMEFLDKLIHQEDRKDLALDFRDATILRMTLSIPEVCPFYDWKIDRKSKSQRQRIMYMRHMLITGIQGIFLMTCCLFIYWAFSLIFR